jgi:hypothetical protein
VAKDGASYLAVDSVLATRRLFMILPETLLFVCIDSLWFDDMSNNNEKT